MRVVKAVPAWAPAVDGAGATGEMEPEITREIAAQYFSGLYSKNRMAWHRLRRLMGWARILVMAIGIGICGAAIYVTWRETGASDLNALYAALGQRAFVLFTGALITSIGAVPLIWRYPWQLAVGLFALGMAIEMTVLDLGYRPVAIGMFMVAIGAIIYSYMLPRRRPPLEDPELEAKLDKWIGTVTRKLIEDTRLPVADKVRVDGEFVLKSFPKRDRIGNQDVACKVGSDSRPRITPMGVAAFDLRDTTMVAFEGAVDLVSNSVLYARVHEFRYDDIIALLWTRDAVSSAKPAVGAGAGAGALTPRSAMQVVAGKKADAAEVPRHRDMLEIRLISGRTVSLVFGDTQFLAADAIKKGGIKLIEDMDRIRVLWGEILRRQQAARSASGSQAGAKASQ